MLGDGDAASGVVNVTVDAARDPADLLLTISAEQQVEVPRKGGTGTMIPSKVREQKLSGGGSQSVPFKWDVAQAVLGSVRFQVKVSSAAGESLAVAWSRPVQIGVRRVHSLAGAWTLASSEFMPFALDPQKSVKALAAEVQLPGRISDGRTFRGWVNLTRTAQVPGAGDWSYRYLRMEGDVLVALARLPRSAIPKNMRNDRAFLFLRLPPCFGIRAVKQGTRCRDTETSHSRSSTIGDSLSLNRWANGGSCGKSNLSSRPVSVISGWSSF